MEKTILKLLPSLPGVYLFKDKELKVIYVGKAKSLKDRVGSYFNPTNDWKIKTLLAEAHSLDHIITKNEEEALLLEAQIVQEHQPRYNTLLKNGQPFIYLLVTNTPLPQLEIVRNKKRKGTYYGPFIHKKQARNVLAYLIRTFQLKICNASIISGCLDYHLELCSGSCKPDFDQEGYIFRLELAQQLIKNNYKKSIQDLEEKIRHHSQRLEFEKAKYCADFLNNLEPIYKTLQAHFHEKKFEHEIFIKTVPIQYTPQVDTMIGFHLAQLLQLSKIPKTIDCFDISHFQSSCIVGSCIRFSNGIPVKNKFRRFKIKTLDQQNDYAALQEIVARRYRDAEDLPDLILIDGGKGQLNAVKHLFEQTTFISLAKKEERLFSAAHPEGIILNLHDDLGKMLIALRDYAHHFAITYQRTQQTKRLQGL
ncbi:MAG: GIY-YIG nuclease family protein [Candidatus Babeliales bacterium]